MAGTEFWRDIKPITSVFKPEAVPEAYISDAPTDDERYYVPLTETVSTRPLWISHAGSRGLRPRRMLSCAPIGRWKARRMRGPRPSSRRLAG